MDDDCYWQSGYSALSVAINYNSMATVRINNKKPSANLCTLCLLPSREIPNLISAALYNKYTTMTEYRSYRELDSMIEKKDTPLGLLMKDLLKLDKKEQCLKKYHLAPVELSKRGALLKYYKYHVSLPPCHLEDVSRIVNKWQHLQLRIYYRNIKKQLNMEVSLSEDSTKRESEESDTHNLPSCTCLLCGLHLQSEESSSKLDERRNMEPAMIKSESQSLYELLRFVERQPSINKQCYLGEDFMDLSQRSENRLQFERYINDHESKQDTVPAETFKRDPASFLKKNVVGLKSVNQVVQEQGQQPRPRIILSNKHRRSEEALDWSPVYNFISNCLNNSNGPTEKVPSLHKKELKRSNKQIATKDVFVPIGLSSQKKLSLRPYEAAMPRIQPRSITKSKEALKTQQIKELYHHDFFAAQEAPKRYKSLTNHGQSGPNIAGNKIKTQVKPSRKKILSLGRMKTTVSASTKWTNLVRSPYRNGDIFASKSPPSEDRMAAGKISFQRRRPKH